MRAKPVLCIETGVTYPSAVMAARDYGIAPVNIYNAVRRGRRAGGVHWAHPDAPRSDYAADRRSVRVTCLETGATYESLVDAAREVGVHPTSISRSCHTGYRAAGLHWRRADV